MQGKLHESNGYLLGLAIELMRRGAMSPLSDLKEAQKRMALYLPLKR